MSIDINKAKKVFSEYVENYNSKNPKVELKIIHTFKVSENSKMIAKELKLDEENILLAELIGLLHDIGRFEQIKKYDTFIDNKSENHALIGIRVLFEENMIKQFVEDRKYDSIIYKAIINHNKLAIDEGLSEEELIQAKIIRDSDKLDIFRAILESKPESTMTFKTTDIENETVTDKVLNLYLSGSGIEYKEMKTNMDIIIMWYAYLYDINYKIVKDKIIENNYVEKIANLINYKKDDTRYKINLAKEHAKEYLKK